MIEIEYDETRRVWSVFKRQEPEGLIAHIITSARYADILPMLKHLRASA